MSHSRTASAALAKPRTIKMPPTTASAMPVQRNSSQAIDSISAPRAPSEAPRICITIRQVRIGMRDARQQLPTPHVKSTAPIKSHADLRGSKKKRFVRPSHTSRPPRRTKTNWFSMRNRWAGVSKETPRRPGSPTLARCAASSAAPVSADGRLNLAAFPKFSWPRPALRRSRRKSCACDRATALPRR